MVVCNSISGRHQKLGRPAALLLWLKGEWVAIDACGYIEVEGGVLLKARHPKPQQSHGSSPYYWTAALRSSSSFFLVTVSGLIPLLRRSPDLRKGRLLRWRRRA